MISDFVCAVCNRTQNILDKIFFQAKQTFEYLSAIRFKWLVRLKKNRNKICFNVKFSNIGTKFLDF